MAAPPGAPPPAPPAPSRPPGTEDGPLWSTIKRQLYRSEVAHVKRLVGEALIQKNHLMWDELSSLKQILTDFEQQNEELSDRTKQQVQFCGSQHRDLLRRQSQLVLADIRAQVEASGHALEDMVPELRDHQLRDFILGGKECRRNSSGKMEGLTPPATPSTRPPSSGGRSGCSTPDPVAGALPLPLGRALGLEELGVVAEGIREALESEHESLLSAIGEQLERLEAEAEHRAEAVGRLSRGEPSTAALQQFVHKLQDVATSPALRTLAITSPHGGAAGYPAAPSPPSPVSGGSNVRRLQALIAQRRLASPAPAPGRVSKPAVLGAVPEALDGPLGGYGGEAAGATGMPFDPFFDDPLFAAAVGAGCVSKQEVGLLS